MGERLTYKLANFIAQRKEQGNFFRNGFQIRVDPKQSWTEIAAEAGWLAEESDDYGTYQGKHLKGDRPSITFTSEVSDEAARLTGTSAKAALGHQGINIFSIFPEDQAVFDVINPNS